MNSAVVRPVASWARYSLLKYNLSAAILKSALVGAIVSLRLAINVSIVDWTLAHEPPSCVIPQSPTIISSVLS